MWFNITELKDLNYVITDPSAQWKNPCYSVLGNVSVERMDEVKWHCHAK